MPRGHEVFLQGWGEHRLFLGQDSSACSFQGVLPSASGSCLTHMLQSRRDSADPCKSGSGGRFAPTHTHICPQHSVETLSWRLWTPSSLHPQVPERDPCIPQPLGTAVLTTRSLDTGTPAPLACILEMASQRSPDMTPGALGFMLAAAPPDTPPSAPLLRPPVHSASRSGARAPQGLFSLPEAATRPGPGAPRTSKPSSGLQPHLLQRGPRPPSKLVLWGRVPHLWAADWYLLSDRQQH